MLHLWCCLFDKAALSNGCACVHSAPHCMLLPNTRRECCLRSLASGRLVHLSNVLLWQVWKLPLKVQILSMSPRAWRPQSGTIRTRLTLR